MIGTQKKILMIGCGAMGSALVQGWQPFYNITIVDPAHPKGVHHPDDLPLDYQPDILVLAVKPQIMAVIISQYVSRFDNAAIVWVSIAAGIPLSFYQRILHHATFVRAMPNLPAKVHQGMTGLVAKAGPIPLIESLFRQVGKTLWVHEECHLDAVTAIAGSGPSYFYALVEALAQAGEVLGLPFEEAMVVARQTAIGAAKILDHSSESVKYLCQQVTSPNGTTAAALDQLNHPEAGLVPLMKRAAGAAYQRAQRLGQDYFKNHSLEEEVLP